ncbi:hypothetical protein LguiA_036119 [Lonicera macranthoides]
MAGAAITIALQQLKGLLGINKFTKKTDIISVMHSVWGSVEHGVRKIKKGINPSSVDKIFFTGDYLVKGFRIGVVAGMIALTVRKQRLAQKSVLLAFGSELYGRLQHGCVQHRDVVDTAKDCDTWEDPEDYSLQEHAAISRRNQGPGAADSQTVTDIDTSGIHALKELYRTLQKRDIQLIIANPGQAVIDKLHAAEFMQLIGEDNIFLTVADAEMFCKKSFLRENFKKIIGILFRLLTSVIQVACPVNRITEANNPSC